MHASLLRECACVVVRPGDTAVRCSIAERRRCRSLRSRARAGVRTAAWRTDPRAHARSELALSRGRGGGGGYHVTNTLIRATHAHRTPQAPLIAPAESASNTAASASTPRVMTRSDPAMLAPAAAGPKPEHLKGPPLPHHDAMTPFTTCAQRHAPPSASNRPTRGRVCRAARGCVCGAL